MNNKPELSEIEKLVPEATDFTEIGSGGYKVVYSARVADHFEAVKLVEIPSDPKNEDIKRGNISRFYREIDIIRRCESPYLVKMGNIDPRELDIDERCFYVYSEELLPGKSLREKINDNEVTTIKELFEITSCGLSAIFEFVKIDVIHRDIKPENIMATGITSRPYVFLDFGIAFHQGATALTQNTAEIPGTLCYIAPEMLKQGFRQNLDYRADLYALGLTIYECATKSNPFRKTDQSQYDTLYNIGTISPESLHNLRPDLPRDYCKMIDQLMKKIPALRPRNIQNLLKKMEKLS